MIRKPYFSVQIRRNLGLKMQKVDKSDGTLKNPRV